MADIPVGKSEQEERTEQAVEAFKGMRHGGSKKAVQITTKATAILAEINANLAKGLVYIKPDGTIVDMPEVVMAIKLSGGIIEAQERPKEQPVVVTKGPIIMPGDK